MAILGRPYPLLYLSKNGKSGLNTVTAKVLKPDLTVFTTLTLVEIAEAGFEGRYTATVFTNASSDPEGEYLVAINEPNGHKAIHRISYEKLSTDPTGDIGINRKSVIEAVVRKNEVLEAVVSVNRYDAEMDKDGAVEAYFYKDDLEYFLDNNQYIGEIT